MAPTAPSVTRPVLATVLTALDLTLACLWHLWAWTAVMLGAVVVFLIWCWHVSVVAGGTTKPEPTTEDLAEMRDHAGTRAT